MKKRTFYIVNLDRNRIMVLSIVFIGFILIAFATGFRFGKPIGNSVTDASSPRSYANLNQEPKNENEPGKSIYSINQDKPSSPTDVGNRREENLDSMVDDSLKRDRRQVNDSIALSKQLDVKESKKTAHKRHKRNKSEAEPKKKRNSRPISHRSDRDLNDDGKKRQDPRTALLDVKKRKFRNTSTREPVAPSTSSAKEDKNPADKDLYSLQIGSFSYKKSATRMAEQLKKQGFHPQVNRVGKSYRVIVGRTSKPKELFSLDKRLRKKNYAPVRINLRH